MRLILPALVVAAAVLPTNAFLPASFTQKNVGLNTKTAELPTAAVSISSKTFSPTSTKTALSISASDVDGSMTQYLTKLFLEQIIVNGVPAVFTLIVLGFAAFQFRPRKDDDRRFGPDKQKKNPAAELYSDLYEGDELDKPMSPFAFLKALKPPTPAGINRGIPALQYIKITNLNQKYDSYDYSLTAATESKAKAAAAYRTKNFDRALRLAVNGGGLAETSLSPYAKTTLLELEKNFLQDGSKLLTMIQEAQVELTKGAIDEEMEALGMTPFEVDPPSNVTNIVNETEGLRPSKDTDKKARRKEPSMNAERKLQEMARAQKDLMKLELNFVQDVVATLGAERANGVRTALLGDIAARGTGGLLTQLQDRPLSVLLNGTSPVHHANGDEAPEVEVVVDGGRRKSAFVTRFPGDPTASQVATLREEVTAIVRSAKPGDEAIVILQTGGGTVTGYGLAAAQLLRFKEAGLKLTIAVEQVAASGGYMMACCADKIVSSPFAVLGSIGVITDIPNVYERLMKEGIEFQTVTAGKYKRTITPTKKVTKQDFEKTKEDVEQILVLFKQFVAQNRPQLDIDKVATGETWFGEDALKLGLTDEIKTADQLLMEYVDGGYHVYEVAYSPPDQAALALSGVSGSMDSSTGGILGRGVRWLVRTLVQEIKTELGPDTFTKQQSPEKKYMMYDDSSDYIRSEFK